MELTYRIIDNAESFESFRSLLRSSNLPADDLNFKKDLLIGYFEGNVLVGTGGLEIYDHVGLLRSLSVKLGIRGRSVGTTITEYLLEEARNRNVKGVYLLTETAHGFFLKRGFKDVSRDEVPESLKASSEFSRVCPTTAAVMYLELN